jgi:hypothetical protein
VTAAQFHIKHLASEQKIVDGVFSITSCLADLRAAAAKAVAAGGDAGMVELEKQLDGCCAACVRLVARLPIEIISSIYKDPETKKETR